MINLIFPIKELKILLVIITYENGDSMVTRSIFIFFRLRKSRSPMFLLILFNQHQLTENFSNFFLPKIHKIICPY